MTQTFTRIGLAARGLPPRALPALRLKCLHLYYATCTHFLRAAHPADKVPSASMATVHGSGTALNAATLIEVPSNTTFEKVKLSDSSTPVDPPFALPMK